MAMNGTKTFALIQAWRAGKEVDKKHLPALQAIGAAVEEAAAQKWPFHDGWKNKTTLRQYTTDDFWGWIQWLLVGDRDGRFVYLSVPTGGEQLPNLVWNLLEQVEEESLTPEWVYQALVSKRWHLHTEPVREGAEPPMFSWPDRGGFAGTLFNIKEEHAYRIRCHWHADRLRICLYASPEMEEFGTVIEGTIREVLLKIDRALTDVYNCL